MTFDHVLFCGRNPFANFDVITGFYCDEAGKASFYQAVERAKQRYAAAQGCPVESLVTAVDSFEFHSDADFPPFRWVG
jgi:hypothetical protein